MCYLFDSRRKIVESISTLCPNGILFWPDDRPFVKMRHWMPEIDFMMQETTPSPVNQI
jgi:hypothetical protein